MHIWQDQNTDEEICSCGTLSSSVRHGQVLATGADVRLCPEAGMNAGDAHTHAHTVKHTTWTEQTQRARAVLLLPRSQKLGRDPVVFWTSCCLTSRGMKGEFLTFLSVMRTVFMLRSLNGDVRSAQDHMPVSVFQSVRESTEKPQEPFYCTVHHDKV